MSEIHWKYLYSEAFKLRSAIAAYLLRDCPTNIELGGYKTPISGFVNDKTVFSMDPRTEELHDGNIHHLPIRFQDWQWEPIKPYGVVMLGLELHMEEDAWKRLFTLIEESAATVIEIPNEHIHSVNQLDRILQNVSKTITTKVTLDLNGNDTGDLTGSAPPKYIRQIQLLS